MEPKQNTRMAGPIMAAAVTMSIALALSLIVLGEVWNVAKALSRPTVGENQIPTPTREQVNVAVAKLISAGRASELYAFYAQEVGDPTRAMLYVSAALIGGAPVDLAMAIGWWEGGHRSGVGKPNQNGSVDYYPMGLNGYTYKAYSPAELKRLEFNIFQGVEHLVAERVKWGVTWESAMAAYNKGAPKGLDHRQIDYVAAVVRHEIELDRRFAIRFSDAL